MVEARRSGSPSEVEVRRSPRRRRTVSAYREDDRTVVLIPAGFTRAQERQWVDTMLGRLAEGDRRRRPGDEPPLGPRQVHPWVLALGGVLALGVMAGWVALACGAAAVGATAVVGRRAPSDLVAWLSGLPVAGAALFYWLRPLGSADGWAGSLAAPQLLVAVTLGLLVSTDLSRAGRPRSLRRRAGRSTSR